MEVTSWANRCCLRHLCSLCRVQPRSSNIDIANLRTRHQFAYQTTDLPEANCDWDSQTAKMFRQTALTKLARPALKPAPFTRAFSTSAARTMAEGDTGAPPKTGGPGDAFQRREHALEDFAIRQREKEKLLELKKRLKEQQAHLKQLEEHIDEITKDQGGEQN